jgi:GAF domain-containing protein
VRPFTDRQVALVNTFANQAVIAMENTRLFNETKEALEQQTASSEILSVISSSPSDLRPVFDAILASATRLCEAHLGVLNLFEGEMCRTVAQRGGSPEFAKWVLERGAFKPVAAMARILANRRPFHVPDAREGPGFKARDANAMKFVELGGVRTYLAVPLLKEGAVIGSINIYRPEIRPFNDKQIALVSTFANQAVIAIENVRLFNETKEALERQTATAEILKVISASPSDVQPVFDAVAVNAARVCGVDDVAILRTEDRDLRRVAHYGSVPVTPDSLVPVPPGSVNERVLSERRTLHVPDTAAPSFAREFPGSQFPAMGVRALLATPLVHDGAAVGVIHLRRSEPRPFTDKQIALLETFADQAVIAIENVRLFNETREALERQTATGEILASMSGSMTETKPVFEAIVRNLLRLFGTGYAVVALRHGEVFELAGFKGEPGFERLQEVYPLPVDRNTSIGEVVIAGQVRKYTPVVGNPAVPRGTAELGQRFGFNSVMVAPMMWKGEAIGAILTARRQALPFDDKQAALIQSFADQAVIAIENVRLFTELESRNRELRVALEQQTATSELLKVIGRSTFKLRPVFETLAENAARLCEADRALIFRFEEQRLRIVATHNTPPEFRAFVEQNPIPLGRGSSVGRAASERRTVHIPDVWADPEHNYKGRQVDPHRTVLAVPMLRATELLGVIFIYRHEVRPFADSQIALVETFADQAVIAIENARLFKELQERTEALTKSVDQLTALGEVGQAISSTLDLEIVLKTIVSRAVQLAGLDGGSIYEFDARDEGFHLRAAENIAEDILDVSRRSPIRPGEGVVGRAGATREPVVVEDVLDESYQSRARKLLIKSGARALLAVPLLREDHLLGALVVSRKSPGPFAPEVVELLKTFATQSAVAIQNARLFREIAEKSSQLEEASRHKSQFLASMSHELRTPLNAILGFNEMILGQVYGEVPSDMKEPLEDIQKSGKHLLRLINNVLDLAKIEAGKMELSLADYSVHDTVESVRSTLRRGSSSS